jgi:hypothetical protein
MFYGREKGSGEGRNRTADAEIFSLSLYRLSYLATLSGDSELGC